MHRIVELDEDNRWALREQMIATYNQLNTDYETERDSITSQIADIDRKLDRLEERFILEEISKELYDKFASKFRAEKLEQSSKLVSTGRKVSNLENCIDSALDFATKLAPALDSSDYLGRQKLQFLVFPNGVFHSRKNEGC